MQLSVFAIVQRNIIMNLIVGSYYNCDQIAKREYGNDAYAVETWSLYYPQTVMIPVQSGDEYTNGNFYRIIDGVRTQITPLITETQQVNSNTEVIDALLISILGGQADV